MGAQGSWGGVGPILYDEKGKPYRDTQFLDGSPRGIRDYLSPMAMGQYGEGSRGPEGGFLHGGGQWNSQQGEWDQPINWGNLLSVGIGGAMGAPALLGLLGGGGAAAGGGSALLSEGAVGAGLPTAGMTPGLIGGAGLGAGAGAGAMAGPGGAAAGAGGGLGSKLLNTGLDTALGLGAAGLGKAMSGGQPPIPPELQQMLDLQKRRMAFQNPLFEAISRLAMSRLPTAQQQPMPGDTPGGS